ncbi:hypothetical protein CCYN74_130080 [Capnocytophaga cynodegmi]|uniref:Uncharacterized protein n=1 Tax=Capnocytophaga cynodegmi TaxID=28189 RepID=A0A0B7HAP2_9FLAO|nr:hypothetical protein CCYN74_130080 [Capnocytophaga cynodegmi]
MFQQRQGFEKLDFLLHKNYEPERHITKHRNHLPFGGNQYPSR